MVIKILCRRYIPGEAWTNRVLAYAKGLSELGCNIELIFLITDKTRTPYEINIPGVTINNLWEKDNFLERRYKALSYIRNLFRFHYSLNPGDKVFIYGAERLLVKISLKKNVDVYAEITEHPYIYNRKGKIEEIRIDKKYRKLNNLKGLFVISQNLKEYFRSIGIEENKLCVSNMIVDAGRFRITKDSTIKPYVAYCGTVSISKDGVDTLLKAFSQFHILYPDYMLYIIGRFVSSEEKNLLNELVNKLRLEDCVIFTGLIHPDEMPKILVNARILALARPNNLQTQNGFPTKLGEYLSTGNPTVVTNVGEIEQFVKDGYNCYLSQPEDPTEFSKKLLYVASHYDEALIVAKRGLSLVETVFSYKTQSKVVYDFMRK